MDLRYIDAIEEKTAYLKGLSEDRRKVFLYCLSCISSDSSGATDATSVKAMMEEFTDELWKDPNLNLWDFRFYELTFNMEATLDSSLPFNQILNDWQRFRSVFCEVMR